MGADLYIRSLQKPVKAEWQPKFDEAVALRNAAQDDVAKAAAQKLVSEASDRLYGGDHYFRDSYNATSVLQRLGLSWWRDMEYDIHDEDSDINVSPEACRRFLEKVRAAPFIPATRAELESRHAKVEDEGENSVEGWNTYYAEKRERLIAFLERAIENGGMYASC
jgi:hypothetical protein